MLDYHRKETIITTLIIKAISNTGSVALAPCPAGQVLFYTPIGQLAREEALLKSTALIGLPGQLKDELKSSPFYKIELILLSALHLNFHLGK